MYLREVIKKTEEIPNDKQYPFNIPAIQQLDRLSFHKNVTFFVGENGSGKSTLLEAIAYQCGFNTAGGVVTMIRISSFRTILGDYVSLSWMPKITMAFF